MMVLQELQDPPEQQGCAPKQTTAEQHTPSQSSTPSLENATTPLFALLLTFD